MTKYQNL